MLPLIPITALVIQNSVNMNTLQGYQTRVSTIRRQVREKIIEIMENPFNQVAFDEDKIKSFTLQVRGAMEIALFIQNIQEERAEVALYIFVNQVERV